MKQVFLSIALVSLVATAAAQDPAPPPGKPVDLVARGRDLFFAETFGGNWRTCGTCHPASNNLTLDVRFIATLPADDPLFIAETNPALAGL